jgi:hypothetical protein
MTFLVMVELRRAGRTGRGAGHRGQQANPGDRELKATFEPVERHYAQAPKRR